MSNEQAGGVKDEVACELARIMASKMIGVDERFEGRMVTAIEAQLWLDHHQKDHGDSPHEVVETIILSSQAGAGRCASLHRYIDANGIPCSALYENGVLFHSVERTAEGRMLSDYFISDSSFVSEREDGHEVVGTIILTTQAATGKCASLHRYDNAGGIPYSAIYEEGDPWLTAEQSKEDRLLSAFFDAGYVSKIG